MTQITGGFSTADAKIEISANGSSWTDISGSTASVGEAEQARKTGSKYTHSGDTAIVTAGKREPFEIPVAIVYTEGTGDPFEVLRAAFEAAGGTAYYFRWSPKGGAGGEFQYATPAAIISGFTYPGTDAESGEPSMCGFKILTPYVTKSVVAT